MDGAALFSAGRGKEKNLRGGAGRGGARTKICGAGRGGAKKCVNRLIQKKSTKVRKFNLRNFHWKLCNAYKFCKRDDDFFKIQENICQILLLISTNLDCFSLM